MSTTTTPNDSPIQPMHNPSQAAHVVVPQAPLGNSMNGQTNMPAGMGAKALLAKKMAKSGNAKYVSPTDKMMTPVSQKLNATKKKNFNKGAKPMQSLFGHKEASGSESDPDISAASDNEGIAPAAQGSMKDDDENPF